MPDSLTPVPRIGVYICHCGINIAKTVDVKAVAEYAATLPDVIVARDYMYMCSQPGQDLIQKDIEEQKLTRVVVAACSPCNLRKGNLTPDESKMWPSQRPFQPTVQHLHRNGRLFPPNYLHESWLDYLYWDTELDP